MQMGRESKLNFQTQTCVASVWQGLSRPGRNIAVPLLYFMLFLPQ